MAVVEKQLIQAEEEMDDRTFTKHMNFRHQDSLGGLSRIWFVDAYVSKCWRVFHRRLHSLRVDMEHEHEDA